MDKIELLDIVAPQVPPPAPPPYGWITFGIGIVALLMAAILYRLWHVRRAQRAARTQLNRTARALIHQRIDARTAAYQIAAALRQATGRPAHALSGPWRDLTHALDRARFAPRIPERETCLDLIERARLLLRSR